MVSAQALYPSELYFGPKPLEIRFRWKAGKQEYFCLNNRTLHLQEGDFRSGTYETGQLLGPMCREFCQPERQSNQPCPAFVNSYKVGTENAGLATVELHQYPKWDECLGVLALLDLTETPEERFFLLNYLDEKGGAESEWRRGLVESWNDGWSRVKEGWGPSSRRGRFDQMLWWTFRFPALVPQVWLNWLHMAAPEDQRALEEHPSRVDFVAFHAGQRHIIEVDGPSHYASYNEETRKYTVDERAYARTLKIWRSLRADGWQVTPIARIEIRDVMNSDFAEFEAFKFLSAVPFYDQEFPERESATQLGVQELDEVFFSAADDDIPF
jgi:hypothetical protein